MFSGNQLKFCSKEKENLVFLKECKPIAEKNVIRHIINNLESPSDVFIKHRLKLNIRMMYFLSEQ